MENTELESANQQTQELSSDEKNMAMFCHLSAFAGYLIPFGSIIGPLIIWLMKKDEMAFVDRHGKESLNFQISMLIYLFVSALLMLVVIGVFLIIGLAIFNLVVVIMASIKASNGEEWEYPLRIPFIK